MPIIKDPKMNPHESRYGIIEVDRVYCYYDKKDAKNEKRFLPARYFVLHSQVTVHQNNIPPEIIIYKGQRVEKEAEFEAPEDVENDSNQEPLVKALFAWAKGGGLEVAINNAGDSWTSDFQ